MSESNIPDLKKTYEQFVFIHQILTQRCQFFVSEFEIAKDATAMVTKLANDMADLIQKTEAQLEAEKAEEK